MRAKSFRKYLRSGLRRFVQKQLRPPFEIILFAGIHTSRLLIFANGLKRFIQSLIKLAQKAVPLGVVGNRKFFADLLTRTSKLAFVHGRQRASIPLRRTAG